jgi:hypothetical protein
MIRPGLPATFWFLAFVAASVLLLRPILWPPPERNDDITFAPKAFYDGATSAFDYVYVAGTLTGEGLAYKNNTFAIACYKDRMECETISVDQIGNNQIGRLDAPTPYPVTKWDASEVVASGPGDLNQCKRVTISIGRKTQAALWVEEPTNQSTLACKNSENKIYKWTLEDPPTWKAMRTGATK